MHSMAPSTAPISTRSLNSLQAGEYALISEIDADESGEGEKVTCRRPLGKWST